MPTDDSLVVTADQLRMFLAAPTTGFDSDRADLILSLAMSACLTVVPVVTTGCLPVVLSVAARAFVNPAAVFSESDVGAFAQFGSSGGLRLLPSEKAYLRAVAGTSGAFSIDLCPAVVNTGYYSTLADQWGNGPS